MTDQHPSKGITQRAAAQETTARNKVNNLRRRANRKKAKAYARAWREQAKAAALRCDATETGGRTNLSTPSAPNMGH